MSPLKMIDGVFDAAFAFVVAAGPPAVGAGPAAGAGAGAGAGAVATGVEGGAAAAAGARATCGAGAAAPHAEVRRAMSTVGAMSFGDIRIQERGPGAGLTAPPRFHPLSGKMGPLVRICGAGLVLLAAGCSTRPDADTLAAWRKEAQEADSQRSAEAAKPDAGTPWLLHIAGQVATPLELPLGEVQQSKNAIEVVVPKLAPHEERRFRGPRISELVARAEPRPEAKTVTIIAKDGYFVTFDLVHLRAQPFILAYEQDGKPSLSAQGGPLSVRFDPRAMSDELMRRYQLADVFYVTHLIVGDEPARLRIGTHVLDEAALDKLPEISMSGPVSYRTGWEATSQTLWGVRLHEVARAAGVSEPLPKMRIFGKDRQPDEGVVIPSFQGSDFERCDPVLVRRFGVDRARISTHRGGPLLLYVKPVCREALGKSAWLSFVEHIEVATP